MQPGTTAMQQQGYPKSQRQQKSHPAGWLFPCDGQSLASLKSPVSREEIGTLVSRPRSESLLESALAGRNLL